MLRGEVGVGVGGGGGGRGMSLTSRMHGSDWRSKNARQAF